MHMNFPVASSFSIAYTEFFLLDSPRGITATDVLYVFIFPQMS